jgi:hypothetical protein
VEANVNGKCSWCSAPLPEKPVEVCARSYYGYQVVMSRYCSTLCRDKSDSMIESYDEPEKEEDGDEREADDQD